MNSKRRKTPGKASARTKNEPAERRRSSWAAARAVEGSRLQGAGDGRSAQSAGERANTLGETVEKLKQSEAMVRTLFRISKKLNATLNVGSLLDDLAQEAIHIVNGESGFAGLRTAAGMTVRKYFRRGEAFPFDHTWQSGQDIPGWVLTYKIPYGTNDAANDPIMLHDLPINA